MENSVKILSKIKNRMTTWSSNPTSAYVAEDSEIIISKRNLHIHVHCSIIRSSKDKDSVCLSTNEWIQKMRYADFPAKENQGPTDSGRVVYLPFDCLKEFRQSSCAKRELIPKRTAYQKDTSAWQGKHLFTKHLLLSSCEPSSSSPKP